MFNDIIQFFSTQSIILKLWKSEKEFFKSAKKYYYFWTVIVYVQVSKVSNTFYNCNVLWLQSLLL